MEAAVFHDFKNLLGCNNKIFILFCVIVKLNRNGLPHRSALINQKEKYWREEASLN